MGTLKELEKELGYGVDESEYEDVTPDWWPEGATLEVRSETDYEHDPLWSGCDGKWTDKPEGVFGDRRKGRLIDGNVYIADELEKVSGCEPIRYRSDVWDVIPENKRVAYVLDIGEGRLVRMTLTGDDEVITFFTPISELCETLDAVWGDGYNTFPIHDAVGVQDAVRRATSLHKRLVKFDEQYCADGKILSEDGPTKWERNSYKYWQVPDDLDGDSEEDVKRILELWKHVESYGDEWYHMDVYVRVTTPDGEGFEESVNAGDVYWGKKGERI